MKVTLEIDTNDRSSIEEARKFLNETYGGELREKDLDLARLIYLKLSNIGQDGEECQTSIDVWQR